MTAFLVLDEELKLIFQETICSNLCSLSQTFEMWRTEQSDDVALGKCKLSQIPTGIDLLVIRFPLPILSLCTVLRAVPLYH